MGIPSYIHQNFARTNNQVVVIDVGCSTGIALTGCKECLATKNVRVYAIGIDPHAKETVESRLDEFITKEAADIDDYIGQADVVICVNVLNSIHRNSKKIFLDAIKFLKIGGIVITDAHKLPAEYLKGFKTRSDFKRNTLCCSKCSWSYLLYIRHNIQIYEKMV